MRIVYWNGVFIIGSQTFCNNAKSHELECLEVACRMQEVVNIRYVKDVLIPREFMEDALIIGNRLYSRQLALAAVRFLIHRVRKRHAPLLETQ